MSHCGLVRLFLVINGVGRLFVCLLAVCLSSLETCLFSSSAPFLIRLFVFLALSSVSSLYVLDSDPVSDVVFANISS